MTYPIVGLMFGSKLSSTNLHTILDFPTPVSCTNITNVFQIRNLCYANEAVKSAS